jgi:hypothetical protein
MTVALRRSLSTDWFEAAAILAILVLMIVKPF